MREIKFKFRSVGGMHKVEMIDFKKGIVLLEDGDYREIKTGKILQYTGFKDKNGKEVYEGDIIQTKDKTVYEIVWSKNFCCFVIKDKFGDFYVFDVVQQQNSFSIIGNVYENLKLLTHTFNK